MFHSQLYRDVIKSDKWKKRRQWLIAQAGGCERCFLITHALEVHHKHYDTLGDERDEDLEALCKACHKEADYKREIRVARDKHFAQVSGWATKVYGEEWESWKCFSEVSKEFNEWLEQKGY